MIDGLVLIGGGMAAGLFGSLLGLGGGILIVPLLTLVFNLPVLTAVGVSLICVIVTSGAAAGVYLERHVANLRLGMTLELFTAIGALVGGLVAFLLPERLLEVLFSALLLYVSATMLRRRDGGEQDAPAVLPDGSDPASTSATGRSFESSLSGPDYRVRRLGFGLVGSVGAGVVSALLGIGGGLIKVPVMHVVMGVPLRVATATSNLMIGITASASAIIYLLRGGIDAYVAAPTAIGVFLGASLGSRIAHRIDLRILRGLFVVILLYTAWQMLQRAAS
ncbi:MAG TPA: sulfite exporter TauE/SafE family protein [Candidatus Limnocylindrales bacterium]|nr:sulfite exporter TauE/SafE family protein [Candidatus Limnocylindrales bacterium]